MLLWCFSKFKNKLMSKIFIFNSLLQNLLKLFLTYCNFSHWVWILLILFTPLLYWFFLKKLDGTQHTTNCCFSIVTLARYLVVPAVLKDFCILLQKNILGKATRREVNAIFQRPSNLELRGETLSQDIKKVKTMNCLILGYLEILSNANSFGRSFW